MNKLKVVYDSIIGSKLRSSLLIGIVCIATFGNTLFNDYNLDDNLVTQNHRLTAKGIKAIPEIYRSPYYQDDMGYSYGYRPTTLASFAIEHDLFGESPLTSHSINLLLYLVTCILVFLLISRIFPDQIGIALGTALLFTVHPIHTEVVASIKNRDEMLALLFALMGCFTLIRPKRWLPSLLLGSFFFFLSLTSKVSGVNFILLLALVPAYPKPFFKDLLLLALYAFSLYFVFEGRDVMFDNRFRNMASVAVSFFVIRFITNNTYQNAVRSAIWYVWNILYKTSDSTLKLLTKLTPILKVFKRPFEEAIRLTLSRKLEIMLAGTIAIFISWHQMEWIHTILTIFIITSFILIPSNKPDAFFRFSFVLLLSDMGDGFIFFILLHFLVNLILHNRINLIRQLLFSLVAISVIVVLDNDFFQSQSGAIILLLGLVVISFFFDIQLKWFIGGLLVLSSAAATTIYLIDSTLITQIIFYVLVVLSSLLIVKIASGYIRITVASYIQKMSGIHAYDSKRIMLIVFFVCSGILIGRVIIERDTFARLSHTPNLRLQELKFQLLSEIETAPNWNSQIDWNMGADWNTSAYWSADKIHSWKRPFDYVEHPLSPFAPVGWKIGTAAETIGRYTQALFLPYPLAFYYGFDEIRISHIFSARSLAFISLHVAFLILGIFLIRRNPTVAIGILLYLSSIVLFSGMAEMVAGMFSDRFSYVASFGFCLALVGVVVYVLESSGKTSKTLVSILSILTICSFSAYSICRNSQWKNKLTLMQHDIKNVPNSAQAHNLLGHAIMENVSKDNQIINSELSDVKNAASHLTKATEIYPLFFNAWVDLARVYDVLGDVPSSIKAREYAIRIDSTYPPVILQVAQGYEATGEYEKALRSYRNYLKLEPNSYEAYDNLARILFQLQRYEESIQVCETYLLIDPHNEFFKKNLRQLSNTIATKSQN
ncbi:MAG: tetratricopeptide repeat protein [Flavobacteriales bacterium]|nr:tetratricopeptide repeat protein [Flavobacteriales bacterium]